jgi:hypothetical protein
MGRASPMTRPASVDNRDGNTLARARRLAAFALSGPGERHRSGH